MIHDYTPLEIKLTTPGQRVFYVHACCSVAEVDGQEMVRRALKVPVSLLPLEWAVNDDEHDRVYLTDLQSWILSAIFDGDMLFDTFPLDGRFFFEVMNPDDLMIPNPVGIYEIGQYSAIVGGSQRLSLCTAKEPVRNLIERFYPKFFFRYTFISDSWDPRVVSDHRSAFDTFITAAMLYATAFFFNGDMDEDLSASEWALRILPHMPWASTEARTEWLSKVRSLPPDALIFDAKSSRLTHEFSKLLVEETRNLALRQLRCVVASDYLQALPLVPIGTQIHEEERLASLRNGTELVTAIWGVHYNFKGDPVRTLLAIKHSTMREGMSTLYLGEHIHALLINLDLTQHESKAGSSLQKGRL